MRLLVYSNIELWCLKGIKLDLCESLVLSDSVTFMCFSIFILINVVLRSACATGLVMAITHS